MKIAFIGLGIMGKPMVNQLLQSGYEVIAYDILEDNCKIAKEMGAQIAGSAKEAAMQTNRIITMLPNSPQVKEVICAENGILAGAVAGTIIIDMSSIAPLASQELHEICKKKEIHLLDAPVSGGEPKAIDGTLSIMAGGEKEVFDEVYQILMAMGSSAVYCGASGAGNTTKLANQIIVALNIAAISEAFMLAVKAEVDPWKVFNAIQGGLAGSTVMNAKVPMILNHNFNPGFKIDLHIKDLKNVLLTAKQVQAPIPFTISVLQILEELKEKGLGQMDHSAIAQYYEELAGINYQ